MSRWMRLLFWGLGLVIAAQIVPYGRAHTNPAAGTEPAWDRPETRALADRACFDCHSNQTRWPWYSHVAPVSWVVQNDVDGGRRHLNFSEWQLTQRHAKDAAEQVRTGEMPLWYYLPMHPPARLTDAEKAQLADSFQKMFGTK